MVIDLYKTSVNRTAGCPGPGPSGPGPRPPDIPRGPSRTVSETLQIVLCLACAGLISGLTGFAFALVASGTLLSIRAPIEATALVLTCSILSQALSVLRLRTLPPRATALAMIGPGLLGAPIGIHLLKDLNPDLVKVLIGVFLIFYSAGVARLRSDYRVSFGNAWSDGAVGFLGGILGGIAGYRGRFPPPGAWCAAGTRACSARSIRASPGPADLVPGDPGGAQPLPTRTRRGSGPGASVVLVSVLVGLSLFARIDQRRFRSFVLALLAAIGLTTTALALPGLLH